ncbi:hypothetical protein AFK68_01885 [Hydrocoleum sp. CS-953]|uniref:hypothetical protein n=1 Tax=Hydrocoleum sp. CS-953 TaxID=1671698 RepID=UPI000B9A6391|nr:hypothetical protein [Hydrocoleum sp. CS-953]OZH55857.1 hypothetical protein AFK68_01885 [Hydrocoleum sp. CS-953]
MKKALDFMPRAKPGCIYHSIYLKIDTYIRKNLVVCQGSVGRVGRVGRQEKVGGIIVPVSFCATLPFVLTF